MERDADTNGTLLGFGVKKRCLLAVHRPTDENAKVEADRFDTPKAAAPRRGANMQANMIVLVVVLLLTATEDCDDKAADCFLPCSSCFDMRNRWASR